MKLARNILITGAVLCVSTLAATNIHTYRDNIKLQKGIHHEQGINLDLKDKLYKQVRLSNEQSGEIVKLNHSIKNQSSKIHTLEKQLENASKDSESPMHRTLKMQITAYQPHCYEGCSGRTRIGFDVSNTVYYKGLRIVAVDTTLIKLYSILEIELENGKKIHAIAIDTGGAIRGKILDFLVENQQTAIKFGRQKATVKILREGIGGK